MVVAQHKPNNKKSKRADSQHDVKKVIDDPHWVAARRWFLPQSHSPREILERGTQVRERDILQAQLSKVRILCVESSRSTWVVELVSSDLSSPSQRHDIESASADTEYTVE